MPQLSSNFILRSKLSNFERDSFDSLELMYNVPSAWMDEGHISYCKENKLHYIFHSEKDGVELVGADRWSALLPDVLADIEEYVGNHAVYTVNSVDDLTDNLAKELPLGRIVYVLNQSEPFSSRLYYNTFDNKDEDGSQSSAYLEDSTGWFYPLANLLDLDKYVEKTEFNEHVSAFDDYKAHVDETFATKEEFKEHVDAFNEHVSAFDDYKEHADETFATKEEFKEHVDAFNEHVSAFDEYKEHVDETFATKEEFEEHVGEFDGYKAYVDETFAKTDEISELANNYIPREDNNDKWIGVDVIDDFTGKYGYELRDEEYSYNDIIDKMLFEKYKPEISNPSVIVRLKENWMGQSSINWYDKDNKIILLKSGSTGPDASDFTYESYKDGEILYPAGVKLDRNYTNGLVESTEDQQSSTGFCKIQNEAGEWVYYKKEGSIYHVPATLELGYYRYYYAAFFNEGAPLKNNRNNILSTWDEHMAVESNNYITINASKPVYYNTEDGLIERDLMLWEDEMVDEMELCPSCVADQLFMTPRELKSLYIWNDILGGYSLIPMVYNDKDNTKAPLYFTMAMDAHGNYIYKYDSDACGHRGAIKIKIIF